ncbi:uncharacterized protein EKO05_0004152 [Ascochyta rabiei]|uniref:uncharacterized protein n=1 Tax=Didymella rabiei TaxID=5454 RepID=UPI00220B13C2|nr:uncharacterized protein EKO05_0004152 [Ascochyta rabiei]UPX13652.1 hypothetical protein EKO05_0004152 [Ascochyta rabiei]
MHMFKYKRRSAHDNCSSTQSATTARPTDAAGTTNASSMGSVGEMIPAYYVDSVTAGTSPNADARLHGDLDGPVNEPLVVDFAAMHDEPGINGFQSPPASPSTKADASWLSDDDPAAPPDFSGRRDISHHIPLRTR